MVFRLTASLKLMNIKQVDSFWCKIHIAGDYQQIVSLCRQFCFDFPFCVTVSKTIYIYQGGAEEGVEVGLISYARFPRTNDELVEIATKLANKILEDQRQWSYTILTPDKSMWFSRRDKPSNKVA